MAGRSGPPKGQGMGAGFSPPLGARKGVQRGAGCYRGLGNGEVHRQQLVTPAPELGPDLVHNGWKVGYLETNPDNPRMASIPRIRGLH